MPFGDRTGPRGFGPATGRGAGYCTGYAATGYVNYGPRCFGGGGRGRRNRYYATGLTGWQRPGSGWMDTGIRYDSAPADPGLQLSSLRAQAEGLARTLDAIKEQIESLEAQNKQGAE
jgi:hypothetical protein